MTAADPSTSDEDEVTIGQLDVKPGAALADEEKAGTSPQLLSRDSPAGKRGTASPATPIEDPEPPPFPEGGYGWVAVFCMFMIQFFVVGITNSVGIFTGYFVGSATFPGSANTILAFSSTLGTAGMNLYGPLTGPLAERLTYRVAACTGAIFLAAGGVIMSFANQVR